MKILIAANNADLANVWSNHLERGGAEVKVVSSQIDAVAYLLDHNVNAIVLDLLLSEGSAIAVADFASYRQPDVKVVFVTNSTFFCDGSIFNHIPNACAYVKTQTPPEDLAAIVEHYAQN